MDGSINLVLTVNVVLQLFTAALRPGSQTWSYFSGDEKINKIKLLIVYFSDIKSVSCEETGQDYYDLKRFQLYRTGKQ